MFGLVSGCIVAGEPLLWLGSPGTAASNAGLNLFWAWVVALILLSVYPLVEPAVVLVCPVTCLEARSFRPVARLFWRQERPLPGPGATPMPGPHRPSRLRFAAILLWEELGRSGAHRPG